MVVLDIKLKRLSIDPTNFARVGNETPRISVVGLENTNSLFVGNIQGTYDQNSEIFYTNTSGVDKSFLNVTPNTSEVFPNNIRDGLHMNVLFHSHGMHSSSNLVNLSNIRTDTKSLTLIETISKTSTDDITITTTSNTAEIDEYRTFEGMPISNTNPGYVKINSEIIRYTAITSDSTGLSGIKTGSFNTVPTTHTADNFVEKYELNGICLSRLNTQHNFARTDVPTDVSRSLDSFYLKIDRSGRTEGVTTILTDRTGNVSGFPELFFRETKRAGGINVKSTKIYSLN